MSADFSPKLVYLPCGGVISTIFTFQSVIVQEAANIVYVHKSTIDGQNAAAGSSAKFNFKTHADRMQYIIGRQGTWPKASGY